MEGPQQKVAGAGGFSYSVLEWSERGWSNGVIEVAVCTERKPSPMLTDDIIRMLSLVRSCTDIH